MIKAREKVLKKVHEAAFSLLCEEGYKKTTLKMIAERAGMNQRELSSRHASKEILVQKIVQEFYSEPFSFPDDILDDEFINATGKLNVLIQSFVSDRRAITEWNTQFRQITEHPDNTMIRDLIIRGYTERAKPYYISIFKQGSAEGLWETSYPEEAAEFWIMTGLRFANSISRALEYGMKIRGFDRHMGFIQELMARSIGADKSTLTFSSPFMKEIKKTLAGDERDDDGYDMHLFF